MVRRDEFALKAPMHEQQSPLAAASSPLCSLGLYAGRATGSVVGRPRELSAVEQELEAIERGLSCLTLEGEPGIGKTRLLLAIERMAFERNFIPIAVTADEEIKGPFLLARSIFACPTALDVKSAEAREAVERAGYRNSCQEFGESQLVKTGMVTAQLKNFPSIAARPRR